MKRKLSVLLMLFSISAVCVTAQQKDSVTTLPTITVSTGTVVSEKVNVAFKKAFPDAKNLRWYEMNKMYVAKFIQYEMDHRAAFKANGKLQYDISYGTEKNLPEEMRSRVTNAYENYDIIKVANIQEDGRVVWVINLESKKHLVMLKVEGDEMEEVKKFNKS